MNDHHQLSRRDLITGGAAATAGAFGVAALGDTAYSSGVPEQIEVVPQGGGVRTEAAPPINPAYTYEMYSYEAFQPLGTGGALSVGGNGLSAATATSLRCPLSLPNGSILREVTFFVFNSSASVSLSVGVSSITPPNANQTGSFAFTTVGANAHTVTITDFTSLNPIDTTQRSLALSAFLQTGSVHALTAARVAYSPPAVPRFVPVTPARVYDSRLDMSPSASGAIAASTSRTISVANRRNVTTGVVDLVGVVPPTATAVSVNIAVDQTQGFGFLAVNPGTDNVVRAAAITWPSPNLTLVNGVIVGVVNRELTIIAGGSGSAQVIVDVTGYFTS